jgi:hypothetical protein
MAANAPGLQSLVSRKIERAAPADPGAETVTILGAITRSATVNACRVYSVWSFVPNLGERLWL